MSEKLLVSFENGVKRITFNNPARRNAVDFDTIKLFAAAVERSFAEEVKVVVLSGAGEAFCAGADLQALAAGDLANHDVTTSLRQGVNPAVAALRHLPKPVIARVHGHAAGVGCNFALAADIIIASEQAFFGQVFSKIGLLPDGGGTYFLPRLVGYNKAFELMALGDSIAAQDALALGMINRVVPTDELDATVDRLASRLAQAPGLALAKIKAALNQSLQADLATMLDVEAINQGACFRSQDFQEGVAAFLEKRQANFVGK